MSTNHNSTVQRVLAIAVFAISPLAFSAPAAAIEDAAGCVGEAAIKSVTYKVDGKEVPSLNGAKPGSTVEAIVTLRDNCATTQIGLASYKTTSNAWESDEADKQILSHSSTLKKSGTLRVTVPSCFYQLDFFTGKVISNLGSELYNGRLIAADNGGDKPCTTAKPTTTTVVTKQETPKVAEDHTVTQPTVTTELPQQIETPIEPVVLAAAQTPIEQPVLAETGIGGLFLAWLTAFGAISILIGKATLQVAKRIS